MATYFFGPLISLISFQLFLRIVHMQAAYDNAQLQTFNASTTILKRWFWHLLNTN